MHNCIVWCTLRQWIGVSACVRTQLYWSTSLTLPNFTMHYVALACIDSEETWHISHASTLSHTFCLSRSRRPSFSPSLTPSLSQTLFLSVFLTHTLTFSLALFLSPSFSLSFSRTHSLSLFTSSYFTFLVSGFQRATYPSPLKTGKHSRNVSPGWTKTHLLCGTLWRSRCLDGSTWRHSQWCMHRRV